MYYCYSGSNENDTENLMAAFGEFALLDSEGLPVGYVMQKYNWTETSLSITFLMKCQRYYSYVGL
jgi:hypothetical protein